MKVLAYFWSSACTTLALSMLLIVLLMVSKMCLYLNNFMCFSLQGLIVGLGVLYTRSCMGLLVLGLSIEVGSIFLHIRKLLILHGFSTKSAIFIVANKTAVLLILFFRIPVIVYCMIFVYKYSEQIHVFICIITYPVLLAVIGVNLKVITWKPSTDKSINRRITTDIHCAMIPPSN